MVKTSYFRATTMVAALMAAAVMAELISYAPAEAATAEAATAEAATAEAATAEAATAEDSLKQPSFEPTDTSRPVDFTIPQTERGVSRTSKSRRQRSFTRRLRLPRRAPRT